MSNSDKQGQDKITLLTFVTHSEKKTLCHERLSWNFVETGTYLANVDDLLDSEVAQLTQHKRALESVANLHARAHGWGRRDLLRRETVWQCCCTEEGDVTVLLTEERVLLYRGDSMLYRGGRQCDSAASRMVVVLNSSAWVRASTFALLDLMQRMKWGSVAFKLTWKQESLDRRKSLREHNKSDNALDNKSESEK